MRPHGNASILDDLEHSRRANPDRLCDLLRPGSSVSAQDCLDYALDAVGWNFVDDYVVVRPIDVSAALIRVINPASQSFQRMIDELTYRVYSNMGPSAFRQLERGGFMVGRLVPVGPEWLISGDFVCYPKSDRAAIHRVACETAMRHPKMAFRNPDKLARARQQQSAEHHRFVQFFGADFVVIPGPQLTERMRSFYTFCHDQIVAELAASGKRAKHAPFHGPDYPSDLVASDCIAVTHDEVDGLGLYAEFGMIEEAFADPSLLRHPDYRRRVRDYLDDPTISPVLFVRMAARDPERTNQVFRKLLGRKHFD